MEISLMTFGKVAVGGCFGFAMLFSTMAMAGEDNVESNRKTLVYLKDSLGLKMLQTTKHAVCFPLLANNFESQKNRLLCGPTSAVIVLNTLRGRDFASTNPQDKTCFPDEAYQYLSKDFNPLYPRYTQNNFFNADTVNYNRKTVGQTGEGHFSPVGAYHPGKKYFLVMDTAPSKADWVWIGEDTLIDAMSTLSDGEYRSYLLVADGTRGAKRHD